MNDVSAWQSQRAPARFDRSTLHGASGLSGNETK
jgi:hypothetical protein